MKSLKGVIAVLTMVGGLSSCYGVPTMPGIPGPGGPAPAPTVPAVAPTISVSGSCSNLTYKFDGFSGIHTAYVTVTPLGGSSDPANTVEQRFEGPFSSSISLNGLFKNTFSIRTDDGTNRIGTVDACQ
jgi:hypothetical protein